MGEWSLVSRRSIVRCQIERKAQRDIAIVGESEVSKSKGEVLHGKQSQTALAQI